MSFKKNMEKSAKKCRSKELLGEVQKNVVQEIVDNSAKKCRHMQKNVVQERKQMSFKKA